MVGRGSAVSASVVKSCLAGKHPSSFIDRWGAPPAISFIAFLSLLWGIFALWEGSLSGGKGSCSFWSYLGTKFIFISVQLSEVITGALKELKSWSFCTPSKAAMKGRRRMGQPPRKAWNCPKRFAKIRGSSGQLNWFQHIFFLFWSQWPRLSAGGSKWLMGEAEFVKVLLGCIKAALARSVVEVATLLSNLSVINLCNYKEQVRKYL